MSPGTALPDAQALSLAVALGAGLLIGIERERRKGQGDDRRAAGLRSFAVTAVMGALAQSLGTSGLVIAGAVLVLVLSALAYWKSRSLDPGVTTELALFVTYLIGVLAVPSPGLAAACAAGLAALLAARDGMHRFATQWLTEEELRDGLLLAALGLIVLPLIPARPIAALGGIDARPLAALVLLIMALQAAGHIALRALGPRRGPLAAGFFSGFVSSTATIAALGSRVKTQPAQAALLARAAALSATATWVQAVIMSAAMSPDAAVAILPVAIAGALGAAAGAMIGLPWLRRPDGAFRDSIGSTSNGAFAAATVPAAESPTLQSERSALRPREALIVAALLAGVAWGVNQARLAFGDVGLDFGIALAALVDAHAPVASLAAMHAAGTLPLDHVVHGVLIAISANSVTRAVVAAISGGPVFALRVAAALALSLAAAWSATWLLA